MFRKLMFKWRQWRRAAPEREFKRQLNEKKKSVENAMEKFMAYELLKTYNHTMEEAREYKRMGGAWRHLHDHSVPSPEVKARLS